eukprot:gene74-biopygen8854
MRARDEPGHMVLSGLVPCSVTRGKCSPGRLGSSRVGSFDSSSIPVANALLVKLDTVESMFGVNKSPAAFRWTPLGVSVPSESDGITGDQTELLGPQTANIYHYRGNGIITWCFPVGDRTAREAP